MERRYLCLTCYTFHPEMKGVSEEEFKAGNNICKEEKCAHKEKHWKQQTTVTSVIRCFLQELTRTNSYFMLIISSKVQLNLNTRLQFHLI